MNHMDDLYQQVIIDHSRTPRNYHKVPGANRTAEGYNPLCGDQIHLEVVMDGENIKDIGFQGQGCAISKASASLMTAALKGKTRAQATELFEAFKTMVTTGTFDETALGSLSAFSGVHQFPSRVKCAILSWHAVSAALRQDAATVSTE